MTRQVEPKAPKAVGANLHKVPSVDFSFFDKLGDSQINAANNNFKLYAQNLLAIEQQKLFDQYSSDPVNLANALGKLPEMINDLPPEIQEQMQTKLAVSNIGLIQKAQNNQLNALDTETANNATTRINTIRAGMAETYGNVLQNAISPADQKNMIANDDFIQQLSELQEMAALKNHKGKDLYTAQQKKQILNISDAQLEAAKQFVDKMILNDDEKLTNTQDYYTKFILAPERFMKDNFMDRKTYDKVREYVKKQLTQAKVDVKGKRFNQSVADYMTLQVVDAPGVLESLKQSKMIPSELIDTMEKINIKFNEIDPNKPENPVAMLDLLNIVNSFDTIPTAKTEEDKLWVLAQGTAALDAVADFSNQYGVNQDRLNQTRKMVVLKQQDNAFGEMMDNFGMITQSFGTEIPQMREKLNYIRGVDKNAFTVVRPTKQEVQKLVALNDIFAEATDKSMEAIRKGDIDTYNQIQAGLRKRVAQIKYMDVIPDYQWAIFEKDPDYEFTTTDGTVFKISGFSPVGDIIVKE